MSDSKPSDIILTITVSEKNGKLAILVSGAPEKEMPCVRTGAFADRHRLLDEVWVELKKRKPQVVTVKDSGSRKPAKDMQAAKDDQSVASDDNEDSAPDPVTTAKDDAGANAMPDAPGEPEDLPMIEGDTTTNENDTETEDEGDE